MIQQATSLEQILQRHGDTLYRLALILTLDPSRADAALVRAAASFAQAPPDAQDASALRDQLLAAAPAERAPARRTPAWLSAPDMAPADARLLAAYARLPRDQRLVLVSRLTTLAEEAELTDAQRSSRRDALLALAAAADHPTLPARLSDPAAPEACAAARAALLLDDPALHQDPALRGHLALCEECRALAHAWQQVEARMSDALRGVLRHLHLPAATAQRMRDAAAPSPARPQLRRLAITWAARAMLPLLVIGAIAALVWPRQTPSPSPTAPTGAAAPSDLRSLVAGARATLYQAPGPGAWVQRYLIRYAFPDGTYAPLIGQYWIDPAERRSRIQLTHEAGGGPYELALGDGRSRLWYGITRSYGEAAFPHLVDEGSQRALLEMDADRQREVIAARLQSGAWSLAQRYLQQAEGSALQSWGRQQSGAEITEVISFRGVSMLAGAADAPGGPSDEVTILLAIGAGDRQLREIRELIGPAGGDQISRTVWQLLGSEPIADSPELDRVFTIQRAWNGVGSFPEDPAQGFAPELPVVAPGRRIALAAALESPDALPLLFPAAPPPDASAAAIVPAGRGGAYALTYVGGQRSLTLLGTPDSLDRQASFSTEGPVEQLVVAGRPTLLRRVAYDSYAALMRPPDGASGSLVTVAAHGYLREDLLAILQTLGPLTLDRFEAQVPLFTPPDGAVDAAAQAALLRALQALQTPEPGETLHTVMQTFSRQRGAADELEDPYHYPLFGGRPETLRVERWEQAQGRALFQVQIARGPDGALVEQAYSDALDSWVYRAPERQLERFGPLPGGQPLAQLAEPRRTLIRMLICGGELRADLPGGVAFTDARWARAACARPDYPAIYQAQLEPRWAGTPPEEWPYLADLGREPISTFVILGADGRAQRIESRVGSSRDGELVEAWELVESERGAQLPADVSLTPPEPLFLKDWTRGYQAPLVFRTLTISDALQLVGTPLIALPPDQAGQPTLPEGAQVDLFSAPVASEIAPPPDMSAWVFDDALWRGLAIQAGFTLFNPISGRDEYQVLYLGSDAALGGYLRARAIWQDSSPTVVQIGGRALPGWQIFSTRGAWVLAEFDGTLIAFPDSEAMRAALERFQIVSPTP